MKLISIVGCGRSGSTLLEGEMQKRFDITSLGEVSYIWERGRMENELCGCGTAFNSCDFWTAVIEDAFGKISDDDVARYDIAFRSARGQLVDRNIVKGETPDVDPLFAEVAKALFNSASKIGGDIPLVESSKVARFAASLQVAGVADVSMIHIFRDARGNVHSMRTPKPRPQAGENSDTHFGRSKTVFHAAGRWKLRNLQAEHVLPMAKGQTMTISYEALCQQPESHFRHVQNVFGLSSRSPGSDMLWHSVSGNPIRFEEGEREIRLDEKWRRKMSGVDALLTRIMTKGQQGRMEKCAAIDRAAHS